MCSAGSYTLPRARPLAYVRPTLSIHDVVLTAANRIACRFVMAVTFADLLTVAATVGAPLKRHKRICTAISVVVLRSEQFNEVALGSVTIHRIRSGAGACDTQMCLCVGGLSDGQDVRLAARILDHQGRRLRSELAYVGLCVLMHGLQFDLNVGLESVRCAFQQGIHFSARAFTADRVILPRKALESHARLVATRQHIPCTYLRSSCSSGSRDGEEMS